MSSAIGALQDDGTVLIVIDGRAFGPPLTDRAAKPVLKWLNGGALRDFDSGGTATGWEPPKLAKVLSSVDRAADDVIDLLKNGLR